MKKIIGLILFLLLISSALVYFQWNAFSNRPVEEMLEESVSNHLFVKAEITRELDGLKIVQEIQQMNPSTYYLDFPDAGFDLTCTFESGEDCGLTHKEPWKALAINVPTKVRLSYTIPMDKQVKSKWFPEWHVKFLSASEREIPSTISISLTEKVNMTGEWVAAAFKRADIEEEHIHYFAWERENAIDIPLYYYEVSLKEKNIHENITVYRQEHKLDQELLEPQLIELIGKDPLTIIIVEDDVTQVHPLLAVINENESLNSQIESMYKSILVRNLPPFDVEEGWLLDVVVSLYRSEPTGSTDAKVVYNDLVSTTSPETITRFIGAIETMESSLGTEKFDLALSRVAGYPTSFFTLNQLSNKFRPLYFKDTRPVYFNEIAVNDDWTPVHRNEQFLMPLEKVVEDLNYRMSMISEETVFIEKGENSWRIFLNESYFIFNEDKYGVTSQPIKLLNDSLYMPESFYEEVLKVEVLKRDEGIYLRD